MEAWHRYILQIVEFNPPLCIYQVTLYNWLYKSYFDPLNRKTTCFSSLSRKSWKRKNIKIEKMHKWCIENACSKFCELHKWTHHWVLKMRESLFIIALQIFDIRLMKIKACVRRVITDTWHNRNRNLHTFFEIFVPFYCLLRVLLTIIFLRRITTYG